MEPLSSLHCIGICGAGQMGAAAAVSFKRAGYRVLVWNHRPERLAVLETTVATLESWLEQHVGPALLAGGIVEPLAEMSPIDEEADLVLDCIAENMDQKVGLFRRLPTCIDRGTIFITTTSGLSITDMGRRSGCGHLLAGTHFWNPPHLMPLVEVTRGQDTPDTVIDRVCQVVESIGKRPVRVNRDVPGFIGNRLLHTLWREAIDIVERGIASPADVDLVARLTFGLRLAVMGPLENMDLVGLDLIQTIHQYLLADLAGHTPPSPYLTEKVKQGQLGVKSGQGFYDWRQRRAEELIEKRDRQIIHQLNFLKELETSLHLEQSEE